MSQCCTEHTFLQLWKQAYSNVVNLWFTNLSALCLLVTAVLRNDATVWVSGRGAGQPFTVHAVINYPTQYGILYPFYALFVFIMHLVCINDCLWCTYCNQGCGLSLGQIAQRLGLGPVCLGSRLGPQGLGISFPISDHFVSSRHFVKAIAYIFSSPLQCSP